MHSAHPDDREFEPEPDDGGWQPEPPWEPEPESTPWSEYERERDRQREHDRAEWSAIDADPSGYGTASHAHRAGPPAWPRSRGTTDPHFGPAYLAAVAVVIVLFAMGLLTVGQHARNPLARPLLAVGSGLLLLGLGLLALAAWLVRHVDPPA